MNQTQKNIKAYKAALPNLRERVVAVALLLAMSLAMMTSASFAWLTISRKPAVMGVNTTIAANGNLEIALVPKDGSAPAESAVGDSNLPILERNVTWGNLVNLSDAAYGLDNLTLRPAQLNTADLLSSPLYGAVYGIDGRINQLTSNFGFATWVGPQGNVAGYFAVSDDLGVRAISSTEVKAVGAVEKYLSLVEDATALNLSAQAKYLGLTTNDDYMQSLATMMGLFMTANMNSGDATLGNPTVSVEDIENLRDMYALFLDAFEEEAKALAALADVQLFLNSSKVEGFDYQSFTSYYTVDMIRDSTTASLAKQGIQITKLDTFLKDWKTVESDHVLLSNLAAGGGTLKWNDTGISSIVSRLANVNQCTLDGTPIGNIGVSNAFGYLDGKTHEAVITNGILYNFEYRCGAHIYVKDLPVSATVKRLGITVPATVAANISTSAPASEFYFNNDMKYAKSLNTGFKGGDVVAQDTYGLALDMWVRTNAASSYLLLEGNVLTRTETVAAMGKNASNEDVPLYIITKEETLEDGTTNSYTIDLYKVETKDAEGNVTATTWYNAATHVALTAEELGEAEPVAKMEQVQIVTGYEGENRVWSEKDYLTTDSTTQGSGSCYVYYADTPEDQARSLTLLEAFNVAFVDEAGDLLAVAEMDTAHHYAESGRVTVPLVLRSDSMSIGKDVQGNDILAITDLEKNVAKRITAIVYLDGTTLSNKDVLAAADIQGQLNIQFGSSANLNAINNETLENAERKVSATVSKNEFNYDLATAENPMTTTVTVNVDGDEPREVTAFFMRAINSSQGSREETMTFRQNDAGDWVADYTFTAPGKYELRTVRLDGVDYDLDPTTAPKVTVTGFTIESLSCEQASNNHISIMTAANSSTVNLKLKFATEDATKMPSTVQGRFLRQDGTAVNVDFQLNTNDQTWNGAASFLASGEYTLQYLVLDGEYTELDEGLWQTATVNLGMRVAVYTTSPNSFKYVPSEMADNEKLLGMQVKIMDNSGAEMGGLTGVKLTYAMKGSGLRTMDTDLTWDATQGYYVGALTTFMPGVFQFSNVAVAGNAITLATTSPSFTIMSPEPPAYYGNTSESYQYKPNNDAAMNVTITNSAAATVQAYIIKVGDAEGQWVDGTIGTAGETGDGTAYNTWSFKVPTDPNGYQDGNWKLTQLRLWDVFAADGTAYTEESPLEIDVSAKSIATKVVNRVYVTFAEGQSKDFGKDASGEVTGTFMQGHTVSGLNVDIKDFEGNALQGVTDVKLTFAYTNGTSSTYGHYTSAGLTNATQGATITVALDSINGTNYAQSDDATILYAGEYITTFSFKVSGTTYSYAGSQDDSSTGTKALPAHAPVFTVSSTSPTVKVTSVSPTNTFNVNSHASAASGGGFTQMSGVSNSFTDYYATVYIRYTGATFGAWRNYAEPSVTLTLSGMPTTFENASVTFNHPTAAYARTYTFTPGDGLSQTNEIGHADDPTVTDANPKLYFAGKQTVTQITVQYNSTLTFTVDLANAVTINQPQYPPYVDFVINNDSYSGNVPGRVYSQNGETLTITLPGANDITTSWTEAMSESVKTTLSTNTTDTTVYEIWSSSDCNGTTNYYQEYTKTVTTSSGEGSDSSWTRTWRISGWQVGNKTYDLGETITVTGNQTISAVITFTDSTPVTNEYTFVRTETYYTEGTNNITGTPPAGSETTTDDGEWDDHPQGNPIINEVKTPK